jgi:phenylalanyl-tRNA synthetase alpha subunit
MSDPGGYFYYTQEQNELKKYWNMTVANHGWSGGIYKIEERNIVCQIIDLLEQKHINSIQINKSQNLAQYEKVNIDRSRNENAFLFTLHNNIKQINADQMLFGTYSSGNPHRQNIYKLTRSELLVDKSGTWHKQRSTENGYVFAGEKLSNEKFESVKNLIDEIPDKFLERNWKGFSNRAVNEFYENRIVLEFSNADFSRSISLDVFEFKPSKLPKQIREFRTKLNQAMLKLAE